WLLQSGGLEDIDDLAFGCDRFCDELPNSMVQFFNRLARAARFRESNLDLLKETDVVANFYRFFCSRAERERLRKLGYNLDEAFFAILQLENVFLCAGKERYLFGWRSVMPFRPVETVHHATRDLVFLQHNGDS